MIKSIGLIEVMNISKGIKITDEMLKSADINLIERAVYNLDLLNGVEYSSSEISSNHIGTITVPLFQMNKCEVIKKIKY